ncbi:MAG: ABC transporter permease subunit, partial [Deltaproteobacteria bacterium]
MAEQTSLSIFRKRWRKFRTLKRGWYSFLLLTCLYLLSFANPLLVNSKALVVSYEGRLHFPVFGTHYEASDFGQKGYIGEAKYRALKKQWEQEGSDNWVILPPYPYDPIESLSRYGEGMPFDPPSREHWMGLDDRGRDVFARLVYGFRVSITFALGVVAASYALGVTVGAILGFFGGWVDIIAQRFVEIWAGLPFLYTVIIISSIIQPNLLVLLLLLAIFRWMGISYYIRGEFYREKSKDYVAAAIAQGESHVSIMFRHVLPNSLTPVVSFAPFAIVGAINSLVALDFLGFGLPAPTPSWGE